MQTIPNSNRRTRDDIGSFNYKLNASIPKVHQGKSDERPSRWSKHSLTFPSTPEKNTLNSTMQDSITIAHPPSQPIRRSRTSRFRQQTKPQQGHQDDSEKPTMSSKTTNAVATPDEQRPETKDEIIAEAPLPKVKTEKPAQAKAEPAKAKKPRRQLRPRKALITLSSNAIEHLKALLDQPEPQLIRIGVKNRGCSGLTYHLEYVTEPGKFDEIVEQDGVKVIIDSKALFSIVGSEMDWLDDKLSSRFIFKNPNSKGTCGCGESFMV